MAAYRQGNYMAALRNWLPLAERGDAPSQSSVGFLYNYGHGVERNYREALKWYRKAAEQGFAPAQYHLGFLYTKGLGVEQDYVKAHMWFELGAAGGLSYSDKNRAIVARRMTPTQIALARDMARNWRAAEEKRLRGGAATKTAARRTAAARKTAAKKTAARKPAAQRAEPRKAPEAAPTPAPEAAAKSPDPVSPVEVAADGGASGKGQESPPLRKASATVPAVKTPVTPVPAVNAGEAKAKKAETGAAETSNRAPAPNALAKAVPTGATVARHSPEPEKTRKSGADSGPVLLQLGASKSQALALKAIDRITKKHASVLGGVTIRAVRKDLGARGVYYRLRAGPIAYGAAGRALCRKLSARGQSCLLLRP
ncbi:MAG: SPOR domain-containing protein [Alphaproteobacteria bacterium]|nr:SPOR domain-containing protein [Alphaproteobacteria bacterium]